MRNAEFEDPRLVQIYDAECPWSRDDDFFRSLVDDARAERVLDFGCGTGRLALGLGASGRTITGVDPARASLTAAKAKPGAGRVTWIEGTAARLGSTEFDFALMTSHVAQFFVRDSEWETLLASLRRALVPGGLLAFDSRDPADRRWERWNPQESRRKIPLPDGGVVTAWTEVTHLDEGKGIVSFTHHYQYPHGEPLRSESTLRFRSEAEIRASLEAAGFEVENIWGGWEREPIGAKDGELIVLARAQPNA